MNETDQTFLKATEVAYTFADGPLDVLAGIDISIRAGAFIALLGPSGVGKSTLLRILAGLLRPSTGEVMLSGKSASLSSEPIGVVFQKGNLMPWRTVTENIRLPLELNGISGEAADTRVQEMLELVGLTGFEESYPSQLSGGMAQRVAIARALVHKPGLLLLDEPFGSLDALTRERMGQELLRIWQANPVTVFMVTHSINEAVLLADEVLVMGGKPAAGMPANLTHRFDINLARPRHISIEGTAEFQQCAAAIRAAIQDYI